MYNAYIPNQCKMQLLPEQATELLLHFLTDITYKIVLFARLCTNHTTTCPPFRFANDHRSRANKEKNRNKPTFSMQDDRQLPTNILLATSSENALTNTKSHDKNTRTIANINIVKISRVLLKNV